MRFGLILLIACAPKIERGPNAQARAETTHPWVERDEPGNLIYLQAMVPAGSAYDPPGQEGLAALTAAAMVDAGAGERTAQQLREALYPTGQEIEVVVDREYVSFRLHCHLDHATVCAQAFVDVLAHPRFRGADVERLRERAADAVTVGLSADEEALGENALYATVFEAHPYGHPIQGRASALERLGSEQLQGFHHTHYMRSSVGIGVAGPLSPEARQVLETGLASLPSGSPPDLLLPRPTKPDGRELVILDTETPVTGFHLGHAVNVSRNHPDWAALKLGLAILGQHRESSGRLFRSIRTARGLNYGTYAYAEAFVPRRGSKLPENGVLHQQNHISLWIRPTSIENGPFALKLAIDELERFVADGVFQAEFDAMQQHLIRFSPLEALSPGRRLAYALDASMTHTPNLLDWVPKALAETTLDQVNTALKAHLHPNAMFIVAVSGQGELLKKRLSEDTDTSIVYADVSPDAAQAKRDREIARKPLAIHQVFLQPAAGLFR